MSTYTIRQPIVRNVQAWTIKEILSTIGNGGWEKLPDLIKENIEYITLSNNSIRITSLSFDEDYDDVFVDSLEYYLVFEPNKSLLAMSPEDFNQMYIIESEQ
jgi:hypothetical protein